MIDLGCWQLGGVDARRPFYGSLCVDVAAAAVVLAVFHRWFPVSVLVVGMSVRMFSSSVVSCFVCFVYMAIHGQVTREGDFVIMSCTCHCFVSLCFSHREGTLLGLPVPGCAGQNW